VEFYLQSLKYIVFRIVPTPMLCACFAALKLEDVRTCMGDPEANADNPLLKAEQDAQVGYSSALRSLFCFVTHSIHTLFLLLLCPVHLLMS
jgi:hypothetical protein